MYNYCYIFSNEILSTVEIRNDKNYGRFSLYLSSQLMYGATKILFYQTKYFQGQFFKFYKLIFRFIFKNKYIFHFFLYYRLSI